MIKISSGNIRGISTRFFRKINAPYRLTVTNEETMAEALTVHLTKKSVYIFLSTLIVLIFLLLTTLFLFTPLKYYIPGANTNISRTKLMQLQQLADSLEKINTARERYINNLIQISNGTVSVKQDSSMLSEKQIELANRLNVNKIDHADNYAYIKSLQQDSATTNMNLIKDTVQKKRKVRKKN